MKKDNFKFNDEQKQNLRGAWAKPNEIIDEFIEQVELEVSYWKKHFAGYVSPKKKRDKLNKLNKLATSFLKEISSTDAWTVGLIESEMIKEKSIDDLILQETQNGEINCESLLSSVNGDELLLMCCLLDSMIEANGRIMNRFNLKPGRDSNRYHVLCFFIGQQYCKVIGKCPSNSEGGNFVKFINILCSVLDIQIGIETIKNAVNDIKKKRVTFIK